MTVIRQQKSLLLGPDCLPFKCYIELIRVLFIFFVCFAFWRRSSQTATLSAINEYFN